MHIEKLIEFYAPENSNLKVFSLEKKFSFELTTSKTEQRLVFFIKKTNQFYIIILTINMQN